MTVITLPDGAKLAYDILGIEHLGNKEPLVLVCGMGAVKGDWERLSHCLAQSRPVLVFDHRGIGDSTMPTNVDGHANKDTITIESMARDMLFLLSSCRWTEISVCGFSMGGIVAQQMLLLPYHPSNPTPLPFRTTHLFLAATRSSVLRDESYKLRFNVSPQSKPRSLAERRERSRDVLRQTFDTAWLSDEKNKKRLEYLIERSTTGSVRPPQTIHKQGAAVVNFEFVNLLPKLPREMQVVVIHGRLDQVVPFYCAEEILQRIPWSRLVEIGKQPGQVPNYEFGHHFYEYFDIAVWRNLFEIS